MKTARVGTNVRDKRTGFSTYVTDRTYPRDEFWVGTCSAEVFLKKTSPKGVDGNQWFTEQEFNKRFEVLDFSTRKYKEVESNNREFFDTLKDSELFKKFTSTTNRDTSQALYLVALCDCDWSKYVLLEEQLANLTGWPCGGGLVPGCKEKRDEVLNSKVTKKYDFSEFVTK